MTSQERYSAHAQLEHLQAKYVGTGHSDTTKLCAPQLFFSLPATHLTLAHSILCSEWGVNQHRDSLALYVGFDSLSQYIAVAENESIGRVKFNCLQVCGPHALKPAPRRLPEALCVRHAETVR